MAVAQSISIIYQQKVSTVTGWIESHLDDALEPMELAKLAHVSPFHFHRIFRGVTGESIAGYTRRLRLERAAKRLRDTQASVTDLAFQSGYNSHEAFTRAFRDHFGVPPSAYRNESGRGFDPIDRPDGVTIERFEAIPVVKMRHIGPYEQSGTTFPQLFGWAVSQGIQPLDTVLGICWDDPEICPVERLRFDACLGSTFQPAPGAPVQSGIIPAGRYAKLLHRGPYDTLQESYLALVGGWVPTTEYELADEACIEIYFNDPAQTPPEELLTEIRVRLLDR
ncbi:AraC family transcriptional regulator [Tuwongella immobilis]|uniref:HTH araC/xylS-type domain-containing protein n=1 Tax=Tuwongella immobilis TaxID=692036 RepID=A0A6C2YRE1_9BACT|nr:AraC family transcriptional regulator [Tuwongella immobilis]VIP03555.1 family transcriptional regulator : Transcription activator effector binding protein OS=Desulfovibrio aespoeensis (strain ATCC 700646 / DSM 10631 / Aspo-2) GN=Daes_0534 PE=4 SV=1: HTH_18: GyrI-like [Tuwongella immobilis]VTS04478.1 family transcriptional regulator : Transcription activator effector binding protein OS=Desulfovibrio aespoeensis (strain ATCC 700646 / DSM 10631 / Aspo-2) GN=Daes_0534 PE=4 SV=1: HTH_18: GyrI-like 